MFGGEDVQITPGMQRYIDLNNAYLAKRDKYIREVVKNWKFDTIAVHGLYTVQDAIEDYQGAIIEPIFMSSSQAYRDSDEMAAALAYLIPTWCYSRIANPSTYYYEWTLALLEGYGFDGETSCCSTSSGMAAIMTAVQPFLVHKRRHVHEARNFVAVAQCYGGTFQQFSVRLMEERDIECRWVQNPENIDEWASKIDKNTRFLYGELPSNPGQSFFDIAAVADLAHSHNLPLICDSTVATPALLRPLCHGADIVVQSATKSITSSGFGVCGALIARKNLVTNIDNEDLKKDFALYVKYLPNRDYGPNLHPMQAIMTLNDVRTLRSKMDLLSRNTMKVAQFLSKHPQVESVQYLGLPEHPLHELASKYMWLVDAEYDEQYGKPVNRYGHLMSFCVKGGPEAARKFFDGLQRIWRATDLGRIKSVATIPAISTHQQQGEAGRKLANIPPNLVRLCVGGEHPDDIIADLDQALSKLQTKAAVPARAHG
ncbi:MAG: O-acetylhomoserine aminocarboxypropyltransferase/cysteine synthase [Phycisphaerae bacterium]|jgi:O-acetylhomoserine/O-acetylserine sulfhydrylase-like pyridoxal-dependent enzyme|nr:O-acetylhomoserine aminocarboxypropyltransferase/cysteine synthase [Phycisphaerae bacterium]NLG43502.1 O-acetylhomoserine aminocarboxypropyltransferase/cysteine synthase [Phycisphaerae bacterium]HOO16581.1 PLP-dependent transferase [Phycisphaerae bacterium]HPC21157.1 PLP-dependent transferase [Phycisphaerae bacterium]HRS26735.1 PLP-dependent transferase [Phycisphaerae bacterium]